MKSDYEKLRGKTDQKFNQIYSQNSSFMQCKKGCHQCCLPHLSVFSVEAHSIKKYLDINPEIKKNCIENEKENSHQNTRCSFLDSKGQCLIYPVRPIVCRSQGAPLSLPSEKIKDVCPLNFTDKDLEALEKECFFNLETLNTLLGLIQKKEENSEMRIPLKPSMICSLQKPKN